MSGGVELARAAMIISRRSGWYRSTFETILVPLARHAPAIHDERAYWEQTVANRETPSGRRPCRDRAPRGSLPRAGRRA